ncbi:hypothetical protein LINPERPRIM_LOCUS237 [Linum perenne]
MVNSPAAQPLLRECEAETRRELGRRASETAINKALHKKLVSWVQKKQWLLVVTMGGVTVLLNLCLLGTLL